MPDKPSSEQDGLTIQPRVADAGEEPPPQTTLTEEDGREDVADRAEPTGEGPVEAQAEVENAEASESTEADTRPEAPSSEPQQYATLEIPTDQLPDCPAWIRPLLRRSPLVVGCGDAAVWSATGRLELEQSALLEVLYYIAAAVLLDRGPGADPDALLDEVWAPRSRTPQNRESGQAWLRMSLGRLQDEIVKVMGPLPGDLVVDRDGRLRLNESVAVSDVEALVAALERARTARGEARIAAAEEAVTLRVPTLLPDTPRVRVAVGRKVPIYRWLDEPNWEQAARRLPALWREAAVLLARAYRDADRDAEAAAVYRQLLADDPLDPQAAEGLLIAAAGTRDPACLAQAWRQVAASLDGQIDGGLRELHARLEREIAMAGSGSRSRH